VYDISLLSNLPSSVTELLPLEPLPIRVQPLFSIGVHDIDHLSRKQSADTSASKNLEDGNYGWVACTTDDVLAMKKDMFDLHVTIPPLYSANAKERAWPRIQTSGGAEVKATQRDFRRYRTLRQCMQRYGVQSRAWTSYFPQPLSSGKMKSSQLEEYHDEDDQSPLLPILNSQETFDDASSSIDETLIEPQTWTALAYTSFMWWASAGEKRTDLDEEAEHDSALFSTFPGYSDASRGLVRGMSPGPVMTGSGLLTDGASGAAPEMAIIAYFQRLTGQILGTLAALVDDSDAEDADVGGNGDGEGGGGVILVTSEDMSSMGLDGWSENDRSFVKELVEFYWGRKADVQGGRVECCGVRIV
jgi:hypothetical protein